MTWSREGGHSLDRATRERIRARDAGRCQWRTRSGRRCGSRDRCEVDHDVPVFEGGTDDDANLRLLCHDHHARKTAGEANRAQARAPKTRPPERHPGRRIHGPEEDQRRTPRLAREEVRREGGHEGRREGKRGGRPEELARQVGPGRSATAPRSARSAIP